MKASLYTGLFLALLAVSGARNLLDAGASAANAPAALAPGTAPEGVADLLFVLSASQAEFTDANTLRLIGVSSTAQFYGAGGHSVQQHVARAKAGVLLTPVFVNSTAGATYVATNGQWLDSPDAALIGDVNNSNSNEAVLLSLSSPTYDADSKAVSFHVTLLAASEDALKTKGGATNELVAEHANGAGTPLITAVTPGAAMSNVALFIDTNRASLKANAATEHWWWFCGPWCGPPGYYGGYGGYGYGGYGGYGYGR